MRKTRGRIRQRIFFIARSATEPTEVTLVMELALEWDLDVRLIRLSGAQPETWVRAGRGTCCARCGSTRLSAALSGTSRIQLIPTGNNTGTRSEPNGNWFVITSTALPRST